MAKQGRNTNGKFEAKSDKLRSVRTMRLTDSAWEKLGSIAALQDVTRADLIEEWIANYSPHQVDQLTLFSHDKEVITRATRKTGTELAHRLEVSSASLTNWMKAGKLALRTKEEDPERIAWERELGTKNYYPLL